MTTLQTDHIRAAIRDIPDFPKKGILFRDITPLLLDSVLFKDCIDRLAKLTTEKVDYVISIESRGFIFGSALAYKLGVGFVPIRKQGKLPFTTFSTCYDLEYGTASIEIHSDALKEGARVIIIDDVLATGGTVGAALDLVKKFHGKVIGAYFLAEISALGGRQKLKDIPVKSLVVY